ncbi:MAG: hypothetical protein IPQ00_02830 [Chloracidobacterium sp.]|nr:hypothetical protein [Chloracidobacterium sp.]
MSELDDADRYNKRSYAPGAFTCLPMYWIKLRPLQAKVRNADVLARSM